MERIIFYLLTVAIFGCAISLLFGFLEAKMEKAEAQIVAVEQQNTALLEAMEKDFYENHSAFSEDLDENFRFTAF